MSMRPQRVPEIPEETVEVARCAFPKGNMYMAMRDMLGSIYEDEEFKDLFSKEGQPAETPWRLALITLMQFAENLTDRQAADAVRARIDWKYALSLPLRDAGFHYSVLSEFRTRLVANGAEQRLFEIMLDQFRERGWIKERGQQRTDSTPIFGALRLLNRLELVGETLFATLNTLAQVAPGWVKTYIPAAWAEKYYSPSRIFVYQEKRVLENAGQKRWE